MLGAGVMERGWTVSGAKWRGRWLVLGGVRGRGLYRAKHLPSQNGTYGDTGFYSGQSSYLDMKVLTFAKNENMRFF